MAGAVRRTEVGNALTTPMTPSPARFDLDQCADCDPVVGIIRGIHKPGMRLFPFLVT